MAAARPHGTRSGVHPASPREGRWRLPIAHAPALVILAFLVLLAPGSWFTGIACAIENTASGSVNASVLDTASATVILNLVGNAVDPGNSSVTVDPAVVTADGVCMDLRNARI